MLSFNDEAARLFLPDAGVEPLRPKPPRKRDVGLAGRLQRALKLQRPLAAPARTPARVADRPDVSVVIGSYNRATFLRMAIESMRENLEGLDGEIIVVDGGSDDGSLDYLVAQSDVISIVQHNRFVKDGEPWRRKSWGGFMNLAFRAAVGRYVVMISDDCLLLPNAISSAIERIALAEAAGVRVGGCAFYFRNWPEEKSYYVQRTLGGNLMVNHGIYLKSVLEEVGYADEDNYVFYKADSDLSLRIWQAGYGIIDSKTSICEHYVGVAEKVRPTNMALIERDRAMMHQAWPELLTRESARKMGKITLDAIPGPAAEAAWGELHAEEAERRRQEGASVQGNTRPREARTGA